MSSSRPVKITQPQRAILVLLEDGPARIRTVMGALDADPRSAHHLLRALFRRGLVTCAAPYGREVFRITAKGVRLLAWERQHETLEGVLAAEVRRVAAGSKMTSGPIAGPAPSWSRRGEDHATRA